MHLMTKCKIVNVLFLFLKIIAKRKQLFRVQILVALIVQL